ncbi:hypothetical protein FB451DRAFT_1451653 [Mycena latifolia]|nr:hypothetical protein FB451DRAFT_1451653 [Mycena latifolia]
MTLDSRVVTAGDTRSTRAWAMGRRKGLLVRLEPGPQRDLRKIFAHGGKMRLTPEKLGNPGYVLAYYKLPGNWIIIYESGQSDFNVATPGRFRHDEENHARVRTDSDVSDNSGKEHQNSTREGTLDASYSGPRCPPMTTEAWDNNGTAYTIVSSVQAFRCSQSLVPQTAFIDSQSRNLLAVEPALTKTTSTWLPYAGPSDFDMDKNETAANLTTSGNFLLDTWAYWYGEIPPSDLALAMFQSPAKYVTTADKQLDLPGLNSSKPLRSNVTLHDVENILSTLVASTFWTRRFEAVPDQDGKAQWIFSISVGLAASIALLLLSLPYSFLHRDKETDRDIPLDGTGILDAMWLYRNHPELEPRLEQVEHPTNDNLRSAGMVRTRLVGDAGKWASGGIANRAIAGRMSELERKYVVCAVLDQEILTRGTWIIRRVFLSMWEWGNRYPA